MNRDKHISSVFDRDLETIQAMVVKMGGMVEAAITDASTALDTRDQELADQVRRRDKAIDAMEIQINEDAARLIALRAPTATDLRMVLAVMKISASLERVGDYAKNMAKRTEVLSQMPAIAGSGMALRRMSQAVNRMLQDALDSYIRRDADLAHDVRQRDLEVDQMYNALFREFLTHMMEDPRNITPCMHLHFIAKNVERMGDHATSIAEQVVYLVTGDLPDEAVQPALAPHGAGVGVLDLLHGGEVVVALDLADLEPAVLRLAGQPVLEDDQRGDHVGALHVRDVDALDPQRCVGQLQGLLQLAERQGAGGEVAGPLHPVAGERLLGVALDGLEQAALVAALRHPQGHLAAA